MRVVRIREPRIRIFTRNQDGFYLNTCQVSMPTSWVVGNPVVINGVPTYITQRRIFVYTEHWHFWLRRLGSLANEES